jgi:hypothetical protein
MAVSDFKNLLRTEGRLQFEGSHYGTGPSLPRPEIEIHKVAATNISEIRSAAARRPILGRAPIKGSTLAIGLGIIAGGLVMDATSNKAAAAPPKTYESSLQVEQSPEN